MTKDEFENYKGNLRIANVSFDTLRQMWEGCNDEYDPEEEEPLAKFYIGKIGRYEPDSYVDHKHLRCSSIAVMFANGYRVLVAVDDVVATDEEQTWEEFLPKVPKPGEDTCVYKSLTDNQKEFADKMFLQLIAGQHQLYNKDLRILLNQTINLAQYRTEQYSLSWDISWIKGLDNE